MIKSFEESVDTLKQANNNNFKHNSFTNKQLKLISYYLIELLKSPQEHSAISLNNSVFQQYSSPELIHSLCTLGFHKTEESLNFAGDIESLQNQKQKFLDVLHEKRHYSFAEVSELIEKGENPPGIQTIDDSASPNTPSQPQLSKPKKPWEP